ncbi:MAG: TIGR02147 family protein [Fibrobacter sp.]|nr:TIGR02147 family protein [Fibrobacter sp.]
MVNIFDYSDFRLYLADYYTEKKAGTPSFSYQKFTEKCGFKNKSFLHQIIHTKKQISKSSIYAISKALGHTKSEALFFDTLVSFNQARTLDEKNHFFNQLNILCTSNKKSSANCEVAKEHFEYYSI